MIELSDDLIFAEGGRRYCFVHPDDPGKCIKTLNPNGDPKKRWSAAPWYKKLRPLSMFDDNQRELKSFNELAKKGEGVWNHFPRCYGIQSTNRGAGMVTDLICDGDGQISKTVRQYVKNNGKTPELLAALETFFLFLRKNKVITRDILDHNIVARESAGSSNQQPGLTPKTIQIYMIDGFGSSEVIPLSAWVKLIGQRKVTRKINRFMVRYGLQ